MKPWMKPINAGLMLAAMLAFAARVSADDAAPSSPTFTKDVLPILQANCQTCHRHGGDNYTGMIAPMSLLSYDEVRPWAKSIVKMVQSREMPPWFASAETHGVFKNERGLSDREIETIARWAATGARPGEAADAPAPLVFPDYGGWRIGTPDLVVTIDPFFVADDVQTLYNTHRVTLTDEMLPDSRWIKAIEWRGGSSSVHHIVGYAMKPGDAATGDRASGYGLGSIAPGEEPMMFPDGYAKLLVKGSTIIFSMHYHKEQGPGTGMWDQSQVAFRFYPNDAKIEHFVDHSSASSGFGMWEIPPMVEDWKIGTARIFKEDTDLIAMHPHMHLRGKNAKFTAFYPDGSVEDLLYVPKWDFDWQTDYSFKEPKRLPAGTRLEYTAHFDNSPNNPDNPDPKVVVNQGQKTTDEMMIGFITFAAAAPKEMTIQQALKEHFTESVVSLEARAE